MSKSVVKRLRAQGALLTIDLLQPHQSYFNAAGERLPSVTTITGFAKPDLGWWHNKQGLAGIDTQVYVQRTADIGTVTHARIEATLTRRIFDESNIDPDVVAQSLHGYRRFMAWWEEQGYRPHANELRLVSERLQVGGTLDIIAATRAEALVLLDIKATNGIHREHKVQVAGGYAPMFRETTGIEFAEVWIVRVGREANDKLQAVQVKNRRACERAFRSLRRAYAALEAV
jgi:hypothetical protein